MTESSILSQKDNLITSSCDHFDITDNKSDGISTISNYK